MTNPQTTSAADRILAALLNPTEAMIKAAEKVEGDGHPAFRYERIIKAMCHSLPERNSGASNG